MEASVQDRVVRVVATARQISPDTLHADTTFEQLGIDSLDRLNLLFDLEGEFDIHIDDEQAKSVGNIGQMVEGITALIAEKEAKAAAAAKPAPSPAV
jgi:acyl carrier protein